jgi:hypothetical protein
MRCHLLTVTVYLFYNAASRYIVVSSVIHSDEISSIRLRCQLNSRCLCRTFRHIGRMTDHLSLILLHLTYCCRPRHLDQSLSAALGILVQGLLSVFYLFLSLLLTTILPCTPHFCFLSQQSVSIFPFVYFVLYFFFPTVGFICLRIVLIDGLLWSRQWTFRFRNLREHFWPADRLTPAH